MKAFLSKALWWLLMAVVMVPTVYMMAMRDIAISEGSLSTQLIRWLRTPNETVAVQDSTTTVVATPVRKVGAFYAAVFRNTTDPSVLKREVAVEIATCAKGKGQLLTYPEGERMTWFDWSFTENNANAQAAKYLCAGGPDSGTAREERHFWCDQVGVYATEFDKYRAIFNQHCKGHSQDTPR